MALGDLTPYQKQNSYYKGIQLGKDVSKQAEVINNSTRELIATQMASTSAIIASQERVNEGIDNIAYGIERVEQGLYGLQATFEWGISEVVWQLEQNRKVLKSIEEGIWSPFDAKAINRKRQAQEAYEYGWIDEAEEYFLESEKIVKTDFSVHISLGIIYLFKKIDKVEALSYFEKAIKYARPKSPYYTSYALLHKALIEFDFGQVNDAEKSSAEAIDLSPNFTEALYQNAQYNAQLENVEKSISNLEKAIRIDKIYCIKADNDPMFDPIRKSVNKLFKKLREEGKKIALESFEKLKKKHKTSAPIITDLSKEIFIDASSWKKESDKLNTELNELNNRINRNSYFDFLEINNSTAPKIQKAQDNLVSGLKEKIKFSFENISHRIENAKSVHKNKIQEYLGNTGTAILIGSFAVPAIMTLITGGGWLFIAFCIPVVSQVLSLVLIYAYIIDYSGPLAGLSVVAWSIVIYLIVSISYLFVAKATSKAEMGTELEKHKRLLQQVSPYVEKLKDL